MWGYRPVLNSLSSFGMPNQTSDAKSHTLDKCVLPRVSKWKEVKH